MEEGKEFMKELLFEIDFGCVLGGGEFQLRIWQIIYILKGVKMWKA